MTEVEVITLQGTVKEMGLPYIPHTERYTGSDLTGSNGDSNRVLTLANTGLSLSNAILVFKNNAALQVTDDFTVTHNSSASTITFLNPVFDTEVIQVIYYTN